MVSPQSDDEQFDFYLKFAKPLVLNLSDTNDRIKAAAWIRKLKDESDNATLRTDYLKLLLFVLQRRKLIGPFAVIPDDACPLQPFPEEINLQDVAKNFVEIDKKVLKEAIEKGGFGEWPPYNVACSSDLKEYAASQEIPNFGVHVYFAISKDPIFNWEQKNKAIFPIGEKIETSNDFGLNTNISPNISSFVPQEQTSPTPEKSAKKDEGGDASSGSTDRQETLPSSSDPFDVEANITPTWGSNLMKVNDDVLDEDFNEEDFDFNVSNRDMLDANDDDIDLDVVEGISDFEDSFYLEGDRLKSPVCTPCSSPAPSLPYKTPPVPSVNLPSPAPSLPYRTPPKPGTPCDGSPDDMDSPRVQSPAPSLPYRTPPMPQSPRSQTPSRMHTQPCQPCESTQCRPTLDRSEEEELKRLEREIFDEIQTHDVDRDQIPEHIKQMRQQKEQHDEGLGGDSFIAPESRDFRWLQGVSPGPGLPEGVEQDPNLWESFGWWTDDPNEIFQYIPPSPRVYGSPDPYAEERERWADVPATPPIFSRDPQIQQGPGAQRIYAIEEFGMESFEEPVWTSAEQYMRYMPESPYQDPRDTNRQTLDMAQYNEYLEMNKQIFNVEGEPEADYLFSEEQPPMDDLEVSFQEQDFQKMTHAQAAFEAIQHGPMRIGAPQSPPPEDQMKLEDALADIEFLANTPPKFVFQPQFSSTPPEYEPNFNINADDFDETISKYVEDEIKIIQSDIPVTTPQRSPSPKRRKRFIGNESLPNIEGLVLDDENIVYSPELRTPPKYHVSPTKDINWDTEIGEVRKVSPLKPAYLGIPDDERQAKSAKRKKELAAIYREQFASPPLVESPVMPPHLIDEPVPSDLGSPLHPTKLPPYGWDWQSPPTSQKSSYGYHVTKTPTGLTPPKRMPEDVTMFYESPPPEIYSPPPSPSSAIGPLQYSPPAHFDSPPSPVRSPGGRPIFAEWQLVDATDEIDMEQVFPDLISEEYANLYISPERQKSPDILKELDQKAENLSPTSLQKFYDAEIEALENEVFNAPTTPCGSSSRVQSPGSPVTPEYERLLWRENLKLHDLDDYWRRQWVVRPKPGKAKAIKRFTVGSRLRAIPDQEEPSSPPKQQKIKLPEATTKNKETLANIEAEIDNLRRTEEEAMRKARQREADRQVMQDIADLTKITRRIPQTKYLHTRPGESEEYLKQCEREAILEKNIKKKIQELESQFVSPPRPCNEPVDVHPLDEPLLEETKLPPALLPPSGWTWKTPPKYSLPDYRPCDKRTPTGLESPEKMSKDVTMYYESPPHELLSPTSPCTAISALQHTPTEGFNLSSSPIRSPGGRPITDSWQIDNIVDDIDLEKVYPAQFEDIYEEEMPELYTSPPRTYGNKISQEINVTFPKSPCKQSIMSPRITNRPLSPVTPEQERQMWKEKLKLHELHEYGKKQWTVRPKPGKTRKVKRFTPRPVLHTIPDEHEHPKLLEEDQERLRLHLSDWDRVLQAMKEVMEDINDLPQIPTLTPPRRQYIIRNDPHYDMEYKRQPKQDEEEQYAYEKEVLKRQIKKRIEDQFASPPRIPSPEPVIHPFDQSLPEELPPALLPPSGWSWQTPPKYKLPDYKPTEKYSPRGISPDKTFSKDVTMFYESPPRELLSPTSPSSVPYLQDFSPPAESPIRYVHDVRDDINLENILINECECIDQEDVPELYDSPTKVKSPEQIPQQATAPQEQAPLMSLEDKIAALECECFGEKLSTPTKAPKKDSNIHYSPETPEYKRQLWIDSLKLHEFDKQDQYPRRQWVVQPTPSKKVKVPRHTRKPKLQTISDVKEPTSPKIKREDIIRAEKKMQESRRIYEEAQKQAMLDILELQQLTQPTIAKRSPCYQRSNEEQKAKLKEDIARRVQDQFSSPPRDVQSEPIITHPFDEELPPDLPSALLPPSGWTWKTPPRLQHQPLVTRKIVSPTGVSPPLQIDPESLLYESPPQLLPKEDLEETCSPCSPVEESIKSFRKSPQSPEDRLVQTPRKLPAQSPKKSPISPFSQTSDRAQICSDRFEDIDQEYPPEEFSSLLSPPCSKEPEPLSDEDYNILMDSQIEAIENAMMKSTQNISPCTPPTPSNARKIWLQELASRSPLQLQNRAWTVKPSPGKSYKVIKSKKPELSPIKEKYLEWSPEVVFKSPIIPPGVTSPEIQSSVTTPTRQPQMPPENWNWKTPSPQALKKTRQRLIEEGVIPFPTFTEDILSSPEIFSESPPCMPQTPPDSSPIDVCSPCSAMSPPQLTPEFNYSPGSESPVISPNISPDISPYRSPLRSPGGRPVIPEWTQEHEDDFYFSEILPSEYESVDKEAAPEDIYTTTLPPTPPPLPASPRPYLHQIRLTPRTRPKPDLSMFSPERSPSHSPDRVYQSLNSPCRQYISQPMGRGKTPESAKRAYEPLAEAVRFEPKRPTPKLSPDADYQTPTRRQIRGASRRRPLNREAPRRRLIFEEENMEDDVEDIQNLHIAMETSVPCSALRDVGAESPPKDIDISVLTDYDYEPEEFALFEDENNEEINIRLPFEGHTYFVQEGSPIPVTDEIPEDERDYRWMPCSSSCQNTPKR